MEKFLSIGLKAIITNQENQVLLLRRSSENTLSNRWDIPGGRIEIGETMEKALEREIAEETGLKLTHIGPVLDISTFFPKNNLDNQIVRIMFFCGVEGEIQLSTEHGAYEWIDPKDIGHYELYADNVQHAIKRLETMLQTSSMLLNESFLMKGFAH